MSRLSRTPRALALGQALADARKRSGLSQRAAAVRLGVSQGTVARAETGSRTPSVSDVATMLGVYGVLGGERADLLDQARDVDQEMWSAAGAPGLPRQIDQLIQYERAAVRISELNPLFVPGLLQTERVARLILSQGDVPDAEITQRVLYRLGRQDVLRSESPPDYTAIIDESALRRLPPGMREDQARGLLRWADLDHVHIYVIPLDRGIYRGLAGGFMAMEFADAPVVVHLEHLNLGTYLHKKRSTAEPMATFRVLLDTVALDEEETTTLLATYAHGAQT